MAANPAEAWAAGEIRRAAQSGAYSPGALTRAGEYLLRGGMTAAASAAARHAAPRARCLLPASVLGIRCALRERDREWALDCTRQAIRASLHPSAAIYEKFVAIKTADGTITPDGEMVEALKSLRREDPSNPLWAQMLGYVRFKRGGIDLIDALRHMSAALQQGATNRLPYLIAAEAARLRGSPRQAVDLLRSGLRRYPEDLDMLNNLAFTLAFLPDGAAEAVRYLPDLLARGGGNPHILDTASLVYLRSGLTNEAGRLIASILDRSDKSSRTWFVTKTRQAEMAFRAGKLAAASKILQDALGSGVSISDDDLLPASELMARIEARKLEEMARTNAFRRLAPTAAPPAAAASP
jgi:tetratricopeptide (TPR) repeat protein